MMAFFLRGTKHNRFGKILIGIMAIDVVLIFTFPIFSSFWGIPGISYKGILFIELANKYPLDIITYFLPFISIIYLSVVNPTKKIVKYIIGGLTIILLSVIICRWIGNIETLKYYHYEYSKCYYSGTADNHVSVQLNTGYNLMNFIMGK